VNTDLGVHDGDLAVHDADLSVRERRSRRSRWRDLSVHDHAISVFTIARDPHTAS